MGWIHGHYQVIQLIRHALFLLNQKSEVYAAWRQTTATSFSNQQLCGRVIRQDVSFGNDLKPSCDIVSAAGGGF
jgi:hypothetical protein